MKIILTGIVEDEATSGGSTSGVGPSVGKPASVVEDEGAEV